MYLRTVVKCNIIWKWNVVLKANSKVYVLLILPHFCRHRESKISTWFGFKSRFAISINIINNIIRTREGFFHTTFEKYFSSDSGQIFIMTIQLFALWIAACQAFPVHRNCGNCPNSRSSSWWCYVHLIPSGWSFSLLLPFNPPQHQSFQWVWS